jgi:hypothetical protein
MKPILFPEITTTLALDQPEYQPLPVCVYGERTISCWQLSLWERVKLLFTGRLWLLQLNFRQPLQPQLPAVDCPFLDRMTEAKAARMRAKLERRRA